MKNSLKLAIPKPCEKQEWSSEFISNKEEFCLLCSEKVYDATTLSDTELHKLVNQKDRPKCMKFKKSQLNRLLTVSSNHFNYKQISNAFYGLLVAGLVVSCSVKKRTEKAVKDCEQLFSTDSFFSDTLTHVIRGIIIDEKGYNYLSNVEIYIGDHKMITEVNELGQFKLEIPDSLKTDTIYLIMEARTNLKYKYYFKDYFTGFFEIKKEELPLNKVFILEEPEPIYIGYYEVEK